MKIETRAYPRKIMRCHARIALRGQPPMRAKTVDVSLGGLCLLVEEQLPVGQLCDVGFETSLNGHTVRVIGSARIVYCILSGTDGFRIGLQYVELDAANNKLLAELMI
ncbi:MAG TPA: PilZ domain-containing protein [Noviherbaspirillum sp.]